jgi:hypothetical protein
MGRKVSDRFTVPICRLHHRELHRRGNERAWWQSQGLDPPAIAATLWAKTHAVAASSAASPVGKVERKARINMKGRQSGSDAEIAPASQNQNDEWHQVRQIVLTLQRLDRRKSSERPRLR